MVKLHELKPKSGSRKRRKKVGRGLGSGTGTFSGRGAKGQKARSGGSIRAGFEGGRMPLIRQVPKKRGKGFKGNQIEVSEVNLSELAAHYGDDETVTLASLRERGLAQTMRVKILGSGDLNGRKLKVENLSITAGAKAAIEKAGGSVQIQNEKSKE